jgi:hypothetical protein
MVFKQYQTFTNIKFPVIFWENDTIGKVDGYFHDKQDIISSFYVLGCREIVLYDEFSSKFFQCLFHYWDSLSNDIPQWHWFIYVKFLNKSL